jgi:hypothetical protein
VALNPLFSYWRSLHLLHLARLDQRQQRAGSPRMLEDLGKILEGTRFS